MVTVVLLLSRQVPRSNGPCLLMGLSDRNCVILRTNRERCALNKEILNLLKDFLEKAVIELVYKLDMKSYHECLKR